MSWDDDRAATESAVAAYFDTTPFTLVAMAKPARQVNALPVADADRPSFDFVGSLDLEPDFSTFDRRTKPSASDRNIRETIRMCLTANHASWPWIPRQGDRVQGEGGLYVLAAGPDRDGTGRIVLWLNKVTA